VSIQIKKIIKILEEQRAFVKSSVFLFFLLISYFFQLTPLSINEDQITKHQYSSVKQYEKIVTNAFSLKKPLITTTNDKKLKVYSIGYNDPGYPILLSYLSILGINFQNHYDFSKLNLIFLWISLLLFFLSIRNVKTMSFIISTIAVFTFNQKFLVRETLKYSDQHGLIPALSLIILLFTITLYKHRSSLGLIALYGSLGGFLSMFRNYIGHAFSLVILAITFINLKNKKYIITLSSILSLFLILNIGQFIQKKTYAHAFSEKSVKSEIDQRVFKHGVWHNMYIGLGYYPNSWDISWSDQVGFDHAKRYRSDAIYPSPKHYLAMKELYFKYVKENPFEYIYNYVKKSFHVVFKTLRKLFFYILLLCILIFIKLKNKAQFKIKEKIIVTLPPLIIFGIIPTVTTPRFSIAFITYSFFLIMLIMNRPYEYFLKDRDHGPV